MNNPIMYYDPSGHFPILIALVLGAFAVAGMITGGVVAHNQGKTGWEAFGYVMLGGALGLAAGGLALATGTALYAGYAYLVNSTVITSLTVLGMEAIKVIALGLAVYNSVAAVVGPIIGLNMPLIDWMSDKDKTKVKKPGETPRHPAGNKIYNIIPNLFIRSF